MKITLAIPKGKKFEQKLTAEIGLAKNIKDKINRDGIIKGLSRIKLQLKDESVFLYDSETEELSVIPYYLDEFIYHCGKEYKIPQIGKNFGNKYLLVLMDANELTIGMSFGGKNPKVLYNEKSNVPRKQDAGGQSELRYEKNRQLALNGWLKHCAEIIRKHM